MVLVLAACFERTPATGGAPGTADGAADSPHVTLLPGTFRYRVTRDLFWSPVASLDVAADGTIVSGHRNGELWNCRGQLTPEQQHQIAGAFNSANLLSQGDLPDMCIDGLEYTVEVVVETGSDAGYSHQFHIGQCAEPPQAIVDAVAVALSPLDTATCDGCPILTEPTECFGHEPFATSFCRGTERFTCSGGAAGLVVDCIPPPGGGGPASYECVPGDGWVWPVSWTLNDAYIVRYHDTSGIRVGLALELDFDNQGVTQASASWALNVFTLLDPMTGTKVPFAISTTGTCSVSSAPVPAQTRQIVTATTTCPTDPDSPTATATTLRGRLHARPYDGSVLLPEFEVPIIDSP